LVDKILLHINALADIHNNYILQQIHICNYTRGWNNIVRWWVIVLAGSSLLNWKQVSNCTGNTSGGTYIHKYQLRPRQSKQSNNFRNSSFSLQTSNNPIFGFTVSRLACQSPFHQPHFPGETFSWQICCYESSSTISLRNVRFSKPVKRKSSLLIIQSWYL